MTYPSLLIREPPIQVLPTLAELVGFNEAAALQEIHYWLNVPINAELKEGQYWVPNVCSLLSQRFYFWGEEAIKYMVAQFEQSGILVTLPSSDQDFNKKVEMTTYHTINYELLKEKDGSPIKLVPASSFLQEKLPTTNKNTPQTFTAEIQKKSPNLYAMTVQELRHFLTSELILEIQEKGIDPTLLEDTTDEETLASRKVICHFPTIGDKQFRKFILDDETLYGILMVIFQMKIMEQLLLFCSAHHAATLIIYADDDQAEALGIYQNFLIHQDETLTSQGEKTEMIMPADRKTFDAWVDFMDVATAKFRQTLWREQRNNPAIRDYLETHSLDKN